VEELRRQTQGETIELALQEPALELACWRFLPERRMNSSFIRFLIRTQRLLPLLCASTPTALPPALSGALSGFPMGWSCAC
jgi:hypothetical protein